MNAIPLDRRRRVGEKIAAARREQGLTQKDLAGLLHLPLVDVDQMERGAKDQNAYLEPIAAATDRGAGWFVQIADLPAQHAEASARTAPAIDSRDSAVLVVGAIVLLVTIRFLSETLRVLPRAANFIDIPIFVALVAAALITVSSHRPSRRQLRLGFPIFAFLAFAALSTALNTGRVEVAPVLVFVYGFLAPLGLYLAVYRLWPAGSAGLLSGTLVVLGIVQLAIVFVVNLPNFVATRNPDEITGTFGTNPYQLVFFLIVFIALLVGIATYEPRRAVARFVPVLTLGAFAAILLAQYRSLLISVVVAIAVVAILLGRSHRGVLAALIATSVFLGTFYYLATHLPFLKLESAATSIVSNPSTYVTGRLDVARNVYRMYSDIPSAIAVGTGPGTYSSRAWQTFANAESTSRSNVQGRYATSLVGGQAYSTDVSDRYVRPQLQQGAIVEGSHAVSTPYSSYTSLLAEVGVIATVLLVMVYVLATVRSWVMARLVLKSSSRGDPLPALALATCVAFVTLLQAALLENWFEVTRVTFVTWIMLAVVTRELDARET